MRLLQSGDLVEAGPVGLGMIWFLQGEWYVVPFLCVNIRAASCWTPEPSDVREKDEVYVGKYLTLQTSPSDNT